MRNTVTYGAINVDKVYTSGFSTQNDLEGESKSRNIVCLKMCGHMAHMWAKFVVSNISRILK